MSSSDPYDDDNFFDDPLAFAEIEAAEAQAIQLKSTQSNRPFPAPSQLNDNQQPKKTSYHHQVVPPRSGPSKPSKPPAPLNTEPGRQKVSGFGWEHNGKRSIEGNVERHVQHTKDRQDYWNNDNAIGGSGVGNFSSSQNPRRGRIVSAQPIEELPMDVVMSSDGKYGLAGGQISDDNYEKPIDVGAADARRMAIMAAMVPESRPPISRSNSSSSFTSNRPPLHTAEISPFVSNNGINPVQPNVKFNSSRTLARSASAGSHILSRPTSAGPSRPPGIKLPPIPSQSSQKSESQYPQTQHANHLQLGSQGSGSGPAPSQGSIARRSVFELEEEKKKVEEEKRKRLAAEEELRSMRAEIARLKNGALIKGKEREREDVDESNDDVEVTTKLTKEVETIKQEMYRYKGEAEIVRKRQVAVSQMGMSLADC